MGVKQLWTLLSPVGRPVLLETMEGRTVAIDSSIWIYQFQATMRDRDGRALVNAHVLGFLRRICKLLFYGIKPVFVFDGGAPALKKHTITERKRKRAGAADNHSKLAQKLLAAQMRREALLHVQKGKQKAETSTPVIATEDTVYLEDLVANPATAKSTKPESPKRKNPFHDYDPYRLPEVDLASLSRPTNSLVPDPRLATEEELRHFIDTMRPEDFDVSSLAFRELPTEIQYEIIGDLRLKSRQTSHKRLQAMLSHSKTPLDFSAAQIQNLKQRNALTQQLLETTDSIGRANVVIPVRIASERNKQYVLIRNEGIEGGWILGANNQGSRDNPIQLDEPVQTAQDDEDSDEMEEVDTSRVDFSSNLGSYHSRMTLATVTQTSHFAPLFITDGEDDDVAIQELLIQQAKAATEESRRLGRSFKAPSQDPVAAISDDNDDDLYDPGPSRLDTALAFANTPSRREHTSSTFGTPILLLEPKLHPPPLEKRRSPETMISEQNVPRTNESDDGHLDIGMEEVDFSQQSVSISLEPPQAATTPENGLLLTVSESSQILNDSESEESESDFEIVENFRPENSQLHPIVLGSSFATSVEDTPFNKRPKQSILLYPDEKGKEFLPTTKDASEDDKVIRDSQRDQFIDKTESASDSEAPSSPLPNGSTIKLPEPVSHDAEDWDAAEEMDIVAEEGDFAELVSQMKNQDLEAAQKEVDEEIKQLNKQRKVAIRDSEDVTQHMISQIMLMLRLFGLPYITAPMEAEAQCAALVSLGLVEGIITDDSDVFLFGGIRVYKNMFNQSKTIECFLLSDLGRELGLDRDTLIRLAYLLGSDYVEGLPGVGPVVAMELLKEFPGESGLYKFKAWWQKVQSGKDTGSDTNTKFKQRFKKRFKNLYLSDEWPNPAVRDAYCHPTVDESDEPFKWGLPDLDALHQFFHDELSWSQIKVDELLVPIIRKIGQRNQAVTTNRQGTLNNYLDISLNSGTYAPRRRHAYSSKRLQQVVKDFRANQNETCSTVVLGDQVDAPASAVKPVQKRQIKKTTEARKRRKKNDPVKRQPEVDMVAEPNVDNDDPPQKSVSKLKLRVKPRPKYKDVRSGEEDSSDSDDLFTMKRNHKA